MSEHVYIKRLANNMLILPISMGRISLEVKTSKGADAVKDALRLGKAVRSGGTVGALGALTDLAGELVNRQVGYARTYQYRETLPYTRGHRIITSTRTPDHLAKFHEMTVAVENALGEFMPRYEAYYNSTDGVADMGESQIKIPHPQEVRESAYIKVGVPQQIRPADLEGMNLPAGLAAQIAEDTNRVLIEQAEVAKQGALKDLLKAVETVETQLSKTDPRIHDSLIEKARLASRNLRDFTTSYDNNPAVLEVLDVIDDKITSSNSEQVKHNSTVREAAVRAAQMATKSIKHIQAAPSTASPITTQQGQAVLGGLIDLEDD